MLVDAAIVMFIIALIFGVIIYFLDRFEKEPMDQLLLAFLAGMTSTFFLIIAKKYIYFLTPPLVGETFFKAFCRAAFVEETIKFLTFFAIFFRSKAFNEPFDGIIYSAIVGLGFAYMENIGYALKYTHPYFVQNAEYGRALLTITLIRSIPGHLLFSSITGYFTGIYKFTYPRRERLLFIGLTLAVLFHGFYDYFIFINRKSLAFLTLLVNLCLLGYLTVKSWKASEEIRRWRLFLRSIFEPLEEIEDLPEDTGVSLTSLIIVTPLVIGYAVLLNALLFIILR